MSGRRKQLMELLADSPNDSELLYFLAMESVAEKDDDQAIEGFRRALNADHDHVASHLQLGQALVRQGNEDEARKVYARGMEAAKKAGNHHAFSEIGGFLDTLG